MTLSPDQMFEEMIYKLKEKQKTYGVIKSHLNHETLLHALAKRPKILVINCHGGHDITTGETKFLFEGVEEPSVVDFFTE